MVRLPNVLISLEKAQENAKTANNTLYGAYLKVEGAYEEVRAAAGSWGLTADYMAEAKLAQRPLFRDGASPTSKEVRHLTDALRATRAALPVVKYLNEPDREQVVALRDCLDAARNASIHYQACLEVVESKTRSHGKQR